MATSIETHEADHYVDFDEYIDFQLRKTQSNVKITDVLTALVGVATLVVAYLLVFVVCDHWLVPGGFSPLWRGTMLGGLVLLTLAWVAWKVVVPYRKRVSGLFAAKLIEKSEPNLKSSLLNLVDLERSRQPISEEVRDALEKRAAVTLTRVDVDHAVDRRLLTRLMYTLFCVVILACLYTLFSPKKISSSIWRAFAPAANVPVPTRTEIRDVRPGDTEVIARTQLEVTVDLQGEIPEHVLLMYTTADRRFLDEPIELRAIDETRKRYRAQITGENGRGILQDMTYRVRAGDASSSDYQIRVIQPPSATVDSVRYEFPSYMELEPRTQAGGHIDAWEGTEVTVLATTNMPVKSARLLFSDTEDTAAKAEEVRMQIEDGRRLSAAWTLQFRSDGTHPHFYRIECRNEQGEVDPQPTLYGVRIRPDLPPEITLLDPVRDLEMPANAVVPLVIQARDPDFRLRYINLLVEKDGEQVGASQEVFEGFQESIQTVYDWKLKPYGLKPGDVLTYWIEARDNKLPVGNRKNTGKLRIRVLDRVSDQQAEEMLEAEKQRQKERLQELRESSDSESQDPEQNEQQDQQPPEAPPKSPPQEKQGDEQQSGDEASDSQGEEQRSGDAASDPEESQSDQSGSKQGRRLDPNEPADDSDVIHKLMKHQEQEKDGEPSPDQGQDGEDEGPQQSRQSEDGREVRDSEEGTAGQPDGAQPEQPKQDPQAPPEQTGRPPADPKAKDPQQQDGGAQGDETGQPGSNQQSGGSEGRSGQDADSSDSSKPGEGDAPADPAGDAGKSSDNNKPTEGRKQPAGEGANAVKRKADGDEQGKPRPDDDPNADPTQSRNDLQRQDGEDPAKRQQRRSGEPNPDQGAQRRGDKPGDADPSADQQLDRQRNPDDRPSSSKDPRDERPRANKDREQQPGNEEMKGPGRPKGQENESEGSEGGEAGNSRQSDQGNKGSRQPGQGDTDQNAGDADPGASEGDQQTESGQPGSGSQQKPGESKAGAPPEGNGEGGPAPDATDQAGDGQQGAAGSDQQDGDQSSESAQGGPGPSKPGGGAAPSNMGGGGTPSNAAGNGAGGSGAHAPGSEQPNLDDLKKATNLVLKELENDIDRGEVDPELLEELGWTEDELQRFAERMRKQLGQSGEDNSAEAEIERRQLEETLRSLDLKSKASRRSGENMRKRATREISGRRIPVPPEYRDAFEAFSRSLAKEADKSP